MSDIVAEFHHPTYLSFPVIVARMALAALFGAAIGFEREWRRRPAGLRTHILICVASATFAILTVELVHFDDFRPQEGKNINLDPLRVVEAVTAGIAFLAAGTILFAKGEVHGLTTGAGMWLAGAIGLSTGLGLWQVGALGTVLVVLILSLLYAFERKIGRSAKAPDPPDGKRSE